ncbi:MAG: hypothetical protein ACRDQZ_20140 [Mycobacteriales bacterium]
MASTPPGVYIRYRPRYGRVGDLPSPRRPPHRELHASRIAPPHASSGNGGHVWLLAAISAAILIAFAAAAISVHRNDAEHKHRSIRS